MDNAAGRVADPATLAIMLVEPADIPGPILPQARPSVAWSAVTGLSAAGRALESAAQTLQSSPAAAQAWTGEAATAYRTRRAELSRRLVEAAAVAVEASTLIERWLAEAGAAMSALRSAKLQVEEATARLEQARMLTPDRMPEAARAHQEAWNAWGRAKRAYWDGLAHTSGRLLALREQITDRPWDGTDQVKGFYHALRDDLVLDPARTAWGLTGELLVDRETWWRNVSGLPGQVWDTLTGAVEHPVETAEGYVDADGWRHGRYGEAAAVTAVLVLPGPHWLKEGHGEGTRRYARTALDPSAPRPSLQTVDEMLSGVDLSRHEHAAYGHTLSRHVDVDDGFLMDRLTHGTLAADGVRAFAPTEASRFTDRATAERAITQALRGNEAKVRAFVASGRSRALSVRMDFPEPVGRILTPQGAGFAVRDGTSIRVWVRNGPRGPYLESAYVE